DLADTMVVHVEASGDLDDALILFVACQPDVAFTFALEERIRRAVRSALSPRHVPDFIVPVPAIPRNVTGKRLEVPVKRLLAGGDPGPAIDNAVGGLTVIQPYLDFA